MGNLWLKIKIWTKSIFFVAVLIYALLFIYNNSGQTVKFWYWFKHTHETSMLVLVVLTFAAGVIGTLLVRMTFRTVHQVKELRERGRLERIEREQADLKAKAAMLQTKTAGRTNDQDNEEEP